MASLSLPDFVTRWKASTLPERAAYQSHFIDLCQVLGEPRPADIDQTGENYTFEKGLAKAGGGDGWADVWKKGFFAWEYKGKHKNLIAAYQQLLEYKDDLDNPPLLVTCDHDRFAVHTNFTNTVKRIYHFDLDDLLRNQATPECPIPPLEVLRALFSNPDRLRPTFTPAQVTEEAASKFSKLAESLRQRGAPSERAAHFLMRILFCLFAEDIGLLPERVFTRLVQTSVNDPNRFAAGTRQLFAAMVSGGQFGPYSIPYFDGGLFTDHETFDMTRDDLHILQEATKLDWGGVEPAIFGTLFERSLDPDKRSQLGAHYTSEADINLVVEPVLMAPMRTAWGKVKQTAEPLVARIRERRGAERTKAKRALRKLLHDFAADIASVRVLDPACGSGNFLYVSLKRLLDLEKQVSIFASENGISGLLPLTSPANLYGIESNVYAHELASVVVWIGFIQWQHDNAPGFGAVPILKPLQNIKHMDAVLVCDGAGTPVEPPKEPKWPDADVIIGNPPFLGGKKLRSELGNRYVDDLFSMYDGRVPREADFVAYWFEKTRAMIAAGKAKRAGLLATQGIRGGANRRVLERIKRSGDIFWAQSDRNWILDGATVHVSMVGFDDGAEKAYELDGVAVPTINSDLTAAIDLTSATRLPENKNIGFMGITRVGPFDIDECKAHEMLTVSGNPNGRPNSDVVKAWINAMDVMGQPRHKWIIDFGTAMSQRDAALYELPFEYVRKHVKPQREKNNRRAYRDKWWLFGEPRPAMRRALAGLKRFIVTPLVSKHRAFSWVPPGVVPENLLTVIAREDDYFFGVLHSKVHELWARRKGTQLREVESGFRYTATTTFETFPFPWPPSKETTGDPRVNAIVVAAQDLVAKRSRWLNCEQRTLTALYNLRPQWLEDAHRELDKAVLAAYGWPADITDDEILTRLLVLNQERAAANSSDHP